LTSRSFAQLGVPADLADRLAQRGITEPFPIQTATLPDALAGRDVSGRAPTGSGKTLAFGLAVVDRVKQAKPGRPEALILVPTRELAAQVRDVIAPLAAARGRRVAAFYGGVGFGPQRTALRKGTDIAVACPGRLADLIGQGDVVLDDVKIVVVDEADRMADMGFLPQVRRLLDQARPDRQTLLFSATLDGDVDVLVRRYQRDPVRHEVERPEDAAVSRHIFWQAERPDRLRLTGDVVTASGSTLVFCRTRRGADRVARQLEKAGVAAAAIHGDRSQGQRERALAAFAAGRVQALVATDVAARGIHVDDVACVVHFDLPADAKDYVHRSGRTGRAGAVGTVVTLVADAELRDARNLLRRLELPGGVDRPDIGTLGVAAVPATPARPVSTGNQDPPRRKRNGSNANGGNANGNGNSSASTRDGKARPRQRRRKARQWQQAR
jgi:superfamily II DNA/RNA helicase